MRVGTVRSYGRVVASVLLVSAACLGLGGCPAPSGPATDVHVTTADELTLGPGDTFEVRVFGEPDLSGPYRLGEDGTIDYPLVGQIKLDGLDPHAAAEEIARRLSEKYVKHPQVSLFVREQTSKKIIVLGQVQKPGSFAFLPGMTIVEALSLAGGFTPIAAKDRVAVTRVAEGKRETMVVNVAAVTEGKAKNVPLRPGDVLQIPERLF